METTTIFLPALKPGQARASRRIIRAANDNAGGRRIVLQFEPSPAVAVAEVEVFGALLAELQETAANDNFLSGGAA
jgi:hypothetical protein